MPQETPKVSSDNVKSQETVNPQAKSKSKIRPIFIILAILFISLGALVLALIYAYTQNLNNATKYLPGSLITLSSNSSDLSNNSDSSVTSETTLSSVSNSGTGINNSSRTSSGVSSRSGSAVTSVTSASGSHASSITTVASTSTSTPAFAITSANISADNTNSTRNIWCGNTYTYHFTGSITATAPGTLNYYWYRDDTGEKVNGSLTFTSTNQSKPITHDVTVTSNGQGSLVEPANPSNLERRAVIQVQLFYSANDAVLSNDVSLNFYSLCY